MFLSLPGERLVFLSAEPYRGPLTLNLSGGLGPLAILPLHTPVTVQNSSILVPTIRFGLEFARAAIWEAPPPVGPVGNPAYNSPAARLDRLRAVAQAGLVTHLTSPLAAALPWLLGEAPFPDDAPGWRSDLERLLAALPSGDAAAISAALQAFLGRGGGLTPSGDDLVMGLLLALSRWGGRPAPWIDPAALAETVLPAARRLTTNLSASLIECAAAGQADERLVDALDGIVTGAGDIQRWADGLRGWGSSSGIDALAGMAVVLKV